VSRLDYISLGLIFFSVITITLGIIKVHTYPGKIAKARNHPQEQAIEVLSLLGLIIFPLWMAALVWAYSGTIEEVENAVVARNQEQIRQTWLQEAVDATQEAVDLVVVQYNTGLTDFNNVLDTQRTLFRQQDKLVDSQGKTVLNLIKLYKALGGGWTIETPKDRDHSTSPPRASEPPDKGGHPAGETQ